MLVGGMVRHIIQDDLQVALMCLLKQGIQVLQGSKERIDTGIIANIIAEIGHGRWEDGRKPDGVNAEPVQVVQLAGDTREISYAICVAIEKAAWVDLIHYTRLPPGVCLCHGLFCSSSCRLFL